MSLIWSVKESRKQQIQRRRQEREVEAQENERFVSSVTNGVEAPPFELPTEPEQRLTVPTQCLGMVIGKKGEHLKSLEQKHKVAVKLDTDETAGLCRICVSGKTSKSVAAAVAELDFDYQRVEVQPEVASWLRSKGRTLKLIKEMTGVTLLRLSSEEDIEGGTTPSVEIKGLKSQVQSAVLCLQAHMSYHSVFVEMEQVEKDLDERIAEVKLHTAQRPARAGSVPCHAQKVGRNHPRAKQKLGPLQALATAPNLQEDGIVHRMQEVDHNHLNDPRDPRDPRVAVTNPNLRESRRMQVALLLLALSRTGSRGLGPALAEKVGVEDEAEVVARVVRSAQGHLCFPCNCRAPVHVRCLSEWHQSRWWQLLEQGFNYDEAHARIDTCEVCGARWMTRGRPKPLAPWALCRARGGLEKVALRRFPTLSRATRNFSDYAASNGQRLELLEQDVTGEFFRVRLAPAVFYRGEGSTAIAEGWIRHVYLEFETETLAARLPTPTMPPAYT
eukprot:s533_g18.t2